MGMLGIGASVIVYILNMNLYIFTLKTGHLFLTKYHPDIDNLREWFGLSNIFLLTCIYLALKNLNELHKKELVYLAIVVLCAGQLVMVLNAAIIIHNPYFYMAVFDVTTLLSIFIIYIYYLNHYQYGTNNRQHRE